MPRDAPLRLTATLLPGAEDLLVSHARELPQRDELCGAFCGALALGAAGVRGPDGESLDQDAVALAAGSVISERPAAHTLPQGEAGRRDYRLRLPTVADPAVSGTTAAGLVRALEELGGGRVAAIPLAGPWRGETLSGLFALACAASGPVALLANIATRHLWGARAHPDQLLSYLLAGEPVIAGGPPADWDVGHFVCIVGQVAGPGGELYLIADTYPALGHGGVHLQPRELLALALERPEMAAGGIVALVASADAETFRDGAEELGLALESWDNGSVAAESPA
ncbi:MAG TPA: hypothetical protein VMG62_02720 [Solirubrobacteraceae bacterium]|nr:hypothetical protein [Solirubrobacteraceae bacterium]